MTKWKCEECDAKCVIVAGKKGADEDLDDVIDSDKCMESLHDKKGVWVKIEK